MERTIPADRVALIRPDARDGLTETQTGTLRLKFGDNRIAEHEAKTLTVIAGDTARDPMLWFLAATGGLFALLGQVADAAVLLLALAPLIGMDFYLHNRTEASLKGLRGVLATDARVIRDARERMIAATDLVPGDLVRVSGGEAFPADGLILDGDHLQADESSLTGEAYPVAKHAIADREQNRVPAEAWAFAGTRLLTGDALVRIVFTGTETIYGEIVRAAMAPRRERTPLQRAVARLVRQLLLVAGGACLLLAAVRLAQGHGLTDAFLSAAVLAVAAIPEEFPVVLTFFLGQGVYRLAQKRALVRQAVAVENIGRVSVICSDKTGTITTGTLSLHELHPAPGVSDAHLLETARMASRRGTHDPLDEALLASGPVPHQKTPVASFPFTEAARREIAIWDQAGVLTAAAKGAPETILGLCDLVDGERRRIVRQVHGLSSGGQKVIACAFRSVDAPSPEPGSGFTFAGLIGIADPLRDGVTDAVRMARAAGIRLVMVTGDHPQTAAAIAREMGLAPDPVALTGDDLERRLAQGERDVLDHLHAVARANPAQKVMLVEAFRERGHITAVTGDGVNDVPALKAADVGIAMGLRGTRSAREVAAIILLDDNFGTIVQAVAEGRQLFRNLVGSFAFLLMVHIPLVATAAIVPLLGYPLLYLPIHIVFLELIIHPAAILGFQRGAGSAARSMHDQARGLFSDRQVQAIVCTGSALTLAVGGLFVLAVRHGVSADHARTLGLVALVVGMTTVFAVVTKLAQPVSRLIAGLSAAITLGVASTPALAAAANLHALGAFDLLIAIVAGATAASPSMLYPREGRRGRLGDTIPS